MKLTTFLFTVATLLGAAQAVGLANAVPAAQPGVVDIADMKLRVRGSSPPPPSPAKREYEAREEA